MIELKRKKVELLRVSAAKAEMELRIHERLDEIERLKQQMLVQEETENKLKDEILKLEKQK